MKLFPLTIITIICASYIQAATAADIKVTKHANHIYTKIERIHYPQKLLATELKSGLPNVIDIIILVNHNQKLIRQRSQSIMITYDLWDEHYQLTHISPRGTEKLIKKNESALFSYISSISDSTQISSRYFQHQQQLELSFQVIFNPIEGERVEKIKDWIRTSNGYDKTDNSKLLSTHHGKPIGNNLTPNAIPVGADGLATISSSGPRFKKLFDKILDEYVTDDSIAAQWKSKVITQVIDFPSTDNENKKD